VPHYVVDLEEEFRKLVVDDFLANYEKGRTPNPCIRCNTFLKFDILLSRAEGLGADFIATGHYARTEKKRGGYALLRGTSDKDQSYALWGIRRETLPKILFPLGGLTKDEVRRIAGERGLPTAERDESQDVCFIPGETTASFLERRLGEGTPGEIVDSEGKVLGRHSGASRYTIGQRRGLGVAAGVPMYVTGIDPETGRVKVGTAEELLRDELTVSDVNWVSMDRPTEPIGAGIQIRYRHKSAPGELTPLDGGRVRVRFESPQRAITPGQSAVFYDGETVLGGGVIEDFTKE
jgi:tRNA-specific 2-thiouridylase